MEMNVNWFQNLTIRSKVILAFAAALLVTIFLGAFSIDRLSTVNDGAVTVSTDYLVAANSLGDVSYNAMRYRQRQGTHIMDATPEAKAADAAVMRQAVAKVAKGWSTYA